jgi:hypothetical protein
LSGLLGPKVCAPRRVGNSVTGQQVGREDLSLGGCQAAQLRMRDIETIDSERRMVAVLRRAARERGGPLPSIDVAEVLLDERRELAGLPRLTTCLDRY